ncbi:MAG: YaeQ family protein [Pseudomonadota bacterium]
MALGSTIYAFDIDLADADRGVYQTLALRVAQHPSETPDYLLTRVLAYCLEHVEGIGFSKGLSDPGEPAISVRDLTGALMAWIDIGLPEPERLHRASKAARRVAVYTHKDPTQWAMKIADAKIHRAEKLEVFAFDRAWLAPIVARLEKRMRFSLARSEGEIYFTIGDDTSQTVLARPLASGVGVKA